MIIAYSGRSRPSAQAIADEDADIELHRPGYHISRVHSDINWGCARANSRLNPDISNSTNKRRMRELFKKQGVPMPALFDASEATEMIAMGHTLVGRPDRHTKRRGFWLIKNNHDLRRALRGTRKKKAATHFMEYIQADREYRVHIFRGKSYRISEKAFGDDGKYTTAKPQHRVGRVRKAAKQAVAALGLDFGCVDVLVDAEGNPYVLEVNAAPGLGGSLPRLYAKLFCDWFEDEFDKRIDEAAYAINR